MTQRELLDEFYHFVFHCRVDDLQTFKNDLLDGLALADITKGWQPIETVSSGKKVILYCPRRSITNPQRFEVGYGYDGWGNYHPWATHWMLPEPPQKEEVKMKDEVKIFELHSKLIDCLDYFDQRADAEWPGEESGMTPNEEMQMSQAIESTLRVCGLPTEVTE